MTAAAPGSETPAEGERVRETLAWCGCVGTVLYEAAYDVDDEVEDTEGDRVFNGCLGGPGGT
jgi:hypothetical protein